MALLTNSAASLLTLPDMALDAEASRRMRAFCRELWRSSSHVTSLEDLYASVVGLAVRNLGCLAAGIWMWHADQQIWKLTASSGPFGRHELDRVTVSIKNPVALADPNRLVSSATARLRSLTESVASAGGVGLTLETSSISSFLSQPAMLAVWSDGSDAARQGSMVRMAAEDIGEAAGSLVRQNKTRDLAQMADAAIHYSPCAVIGLDLQQNCTRWNTTAMQVFGWPEREVLGQPLPIGRGDSKTFNDAWKRCLDGRLPIRSGWTAERWDGTTCPVQGTFVPLRGENEGVREVLLLIRDDSAGAAIARALQLELDVAQLLNKSPSLEAVAEPFLTLLGEQLDCQGAALWVCEPESGWRSAAAWNTPRPVLVARPRYRLPQEEHACDERLRRESAEHRDILCVAGTSDPRPLRGVPARELLVKAGIPLIVDGEALGVILLRGISPGQDPQRLTDVLEGIARQVARRLAHDRAVAALAERESALRQSRKVEAIGMLAGGIVHDFNNLLTVVLGNCELARFTAGEESRVHRFIDEIQMAGERATALSRQLLAFCRRREIVPQIIPVGESLHAFRPMLQRIVGQPCAVEVDSPDSSLAVLIDPVEIEQVLLNMASNARDAMPTGGRLRFATCLSTLELRDLVDFPKARAGEFVQLAISDTGCGMDEATRRRLFEPFFTTKKEGRGTGLGLATVWDIVERAGGTIRVDSQPGVGTTFTIALPRAASGIVPRQVDAPPGESPRGTETVVIVEDEPALRTLARQILEIHGYTVHAFASGAEAIPFLRTNRKRVDLLVTDLMMPGQTGDSIAAEARRLSPDLPVLFMSANHDLLESIGQSFTGPHGTLRKPYASDNLTVAVRRVLESRVPR